ncbi:MAG TPA: family 2 glycosyl transferase [Prolixibacteraceae bacterium]|nr:family 2 glycosyl transferase [Prolixibacteraceae bacterium]
MFADRYIQNNIVSPPFIREEVLPSLSMVVVIPCLNEPEIIRTLESLWACEPIDSFCEVIVTVNDSENSSPQIKEFNELTYTQLLEWKRLNDRNNLVLYPIYAPSIQAKFAGAGMARKIGMDEAVRRLNTVNKPDGVIISTDSDCLFSGNYLQRIENVFTSDKICFAATINFRHRFEEMDDPRQETGIRLYEDYLHYYKQALDFTGFPHSIYTIGSAFAVRAEAYVKQGGMNRRQAGEDFYFLHKLTNLGQLAEITDAFVYPSGRISDRVPFGTGAAMTKWMNFTDDLAQTYRFDAFLDLKQFFDKVNEFSKVNTTRYTEILSSLPHTIQEYLTSVSFEEKLAEINRNSSTLESFRKRFFQAFDAFQVLKFLNQVHEQHYSTQSLQEAIAQLSKHEKVRK